MKKKQLNLKRLAISKTTLISLSDENQDKARGGSLSGLATMCCLSSDWTTCANTCPDTCALGTVVGTAASVKIACTPK